MARTPKVAPTASLFYYAFSDNGFVNEYFQSNSENIFRTKEAITEVANQAFIDLEEEEGDVDGILIWVIQGDVVLKYSLSSPSTVVWTKV